MEEIKLTMEPAFNEEPAAPALTLETEEEKKPEVVMQEEAALTPAEQKMVADFAQKIDITNTTQVMQYGSVAQKKIAGFSESALANVRTKDLGEIGEAITGLVTELKGFDIEEEEKGFLGFFKKTGNKLSSMKAKYDKAEVNVDSARESSGAAAERHRHVGQNVRDEPLLFQRALHVYSGWQEKAA